MNPELPGSHGSAQEHVVDARMSSPSSSRATRWPCTDASFTREDQGGPTRVQRGDVSPLERAVELNAVLTGDPARAREAFASGLREGAHRPTPADRGHVPRRGHAPAAHGAGDGKTPDAFASG